MIVAATSCGADHTDSSLPPAERPRLVVLTDIGGDPDDQQSMIRLMLYSTEFDIEGLIASASGTPGELKDQITKPELIREIVDAYGRVRQNLVKHAEGYPLAEDLLAKVKTGNPKRGLTAIGEGQDTEGSGLIISIVDRQDPRPVNVVIWGGQTDFAQALWRVRKDRGGDGLRKFIEKIRVYDIGDQDSIVEWIWKEFPGMFYVLGLMEKGRDKREAVYRGMYLGGDESLVSRQWMDRNIRHDHGPLGALYPPHTWTAPNPHSAIKEGDTPSWFYFLPHGINDPKHPEWGGWGGRFVHIKDQLYGDAKDRVGNVHDARSSVWRWRPDYQADFQARLDWCVADSYQKANHAPRAVLNGDRSRKVIESRARAGETVRLSAEESSDPDNNNVSAEWFVYHEPGTFRGDVKLTGTKGLTTEFVAPRVTASETVHVIVAVRDDGKPGLSALRRAVVTIEP
jgi:hypothetical protein